MSHEIRTPMTAVLGYLEVLSDPSTPAAERGELAASIRRSGNHLLNLLNDILDLSKVEAGAMELRAVPTSPAELCREVETSYRLPAEEKGLWFELVLGPLPERVETDPVRVRQILLNLVGNAIKFTESGFVRFSVGFRRETSSLEFQVADSGIGMDAQTQARVFERFAQGDTSSTRRHGGAGLGLAIVQRLVALLGGEIQLTSAPAQGTTFVLRVPVRALDAAGELPRSGGAAASAASARGARVLLAEDNVDNQRLVAHFLRKAGMEVDIAANGELAVARALAAREGGAPYDAILMDIDMPVLDGYAATRRLRQSGHEGPIVALTAHALSGDRERCLEAGCDDYLTKPIGRDALVAALAAHLKRQEPGA
jgi:CheY-like chemotaxis protein